jgi:hypothetical protein
MNRYAITLLLAAGLGSPLMVRADDHDAKRYYDKQHKDYHQWNENEERHFSVYLGEKHVTVHTWDRATPREQQEYWNWRHVHPDNDRRDDDRRDERR